MQQCCCFSPGLVACISLVTLGTWHSLHPDSILGHSQGPGPCGWTSKRLTSLYWSAGFSSSAFACGNCLLGSQTDICPCKGRGPSLGSSRRRCCQTQLGFSRPAPRPCPAVSHTTVGPRNTMHPPSSPFVLSLGLRKTQAWPPPDLADKTYTLQLNVWCFPSSPHILIPAVTCTPFQHRCLPFCVD